MRNIGIKTLRWDNIRKLKQDLLYFDQVCFDYPSYEKAMIAQDSAFQLGCILEYMHENKFYNEQEDIGENIFRGQKLLEGSAEGLSLAIEKMMKDTGRKELLDVVFKNVNYLIEKKFIAPVDTAKLVFKNAKFENDSVTFSIPVQQFDPPPDNDSLQKLGELFWDEINYLSSASSDVNPFKNDGRYTPTEWINAWSGSEDRRLKFLSILKIFEDTEDHYVPLFDKNPELTPTNIREVEVLKIVLNGFPSVDENTHWDKIFEFREDSTNHLRLLELKRWIRNMANSDLKTSIIREEFEYLLATYEHQLKLHKIKFTQTPIEIFVVTALDILSDTVKLKWGDAAKKLFEIRKAKVDYLININQLVGKELGYVTEIKEKFKEH